MIQINHKENCCGCEACVQVCPVHCISYNADKEGFYYPSADNKLCIHCNLCEKVCPVINQATINLPEKAYAVQNPNDEIRKVSSSGGIFTQLASQIIREGGVVFGARFDKDWNVVHDFTETIEGLQAFQGSKYVQSRIGNSYQTAEQYLKKGRKVMFTGTSCQIAGLKKFLRKEYENLLAVDLICHGVPSPLAWQKFLTDCLDEHKTTRKNLLTFSFRDKQSGWKKYQSTYTILKEIGVNNHTISHSLKYEENSYMQAFLNDYTLRPSCYQCPAKSGKSCSNITLGDFWGINQMALELDDDKGCSLLIIHHKSTEDWIQNELSLSNSFLLDDVVPYNPSLKNPVKAHINRAYFFHLLKTKGFNESWKLVNSSNILYRLIRRLYRLL